MCAKHETNKQCSLCAQMVLAHDSARLCTRQTRRHHLSKVALAMPPMDLGNDTGNWKWYSADQHSTTECLVLDARQQLPTSTQVPAWRTLHHIWLQAHA